MADYDRTNRGSIWKNDRKETDNHPDFTGSFTDANGVEYWVSAWKRKEDAAPKAPALTFTLKPKESQRAAPKKVDPISSGRINDDMDDDAIPF